MDITRSEIAARAAQFIADCGLDYQAAKRKAAREVIGEGRIGASVLPDNEEIDSRLLEHLQLFDPDHAARVLRYRQAALRWMDRLETFNPYLTGAAWKGIVARHATVHLQLFTDDQKELEMQLIDDHVAYGVGDFPHFNGHGEVPAFHFDSGPVPMLLSVYQYDDLRGALRRRAAVAGAASTSSHGAHPIPIAVPRTERGNSEAVKELLS